MNNNFEEQILDYIEGTLAERERQAFEAELAHNQNLQAQLNEYRELMLTESALRMQTPESAPLGFSAGVMRKLEEREIGFWRKLSMELKAHQRLIVSGMATAACVMLVVQTRQVETHLSSISVQDSSTQTGGVLQQDTEVQTGTDTSRHLSPAGKDKSFAVSALKNEATEAAPSLNKGQADMASSFAKGELQRSEQFYDRSRVAASSALGTGAAAPAHDGSGSAERHSNRDYLIPPKEQSSELYEAPSPQKMVASNPTMLTTREAMSTFSIDVDTASYALTRSALQGWRLPSPASVRTEEFVNYFTYDYPKQQEKPFAAHYEIAPSPLTAGKYLMKIGVRAKDVGESEKPWNLVFLVDVSGSMSAPNRLPLIKQSLSRLVERMRPQDRIALVTYAGSSGVVLDSTSGSEKERIVAAIQALGAGGSTNGASGINLAYDVAQRHKIAGGVNRVILATDGDFNVGVTSHTELVQLIEGKRTGGVEISAIGVGEGNFKDETLEQLANKGNGNYFYLDSVREADRVFGEKLTGMIETVAKDVKIQVEFNPANVIEYRLVGYENRALQKEDFNNDRVDAGEIGGGHTVTALYELVLAGTPAAQAMNTTYRYQAQPTVAPTVVAQGSELASELGLIKIRFKAPEGESSELLEFPMAKSAVKLTTADASADFRFAAAVAGFAEILRQSGLGITLQFKQIAELASGSLGNDPNSERAEFVTLVRQAAAIKQQP